MHVALAFGLTVLTMAYAATQVFAAVLAALALWVIAHGAGGFDSTDSGFASNGYGDRSPEGYDWWAALFAGGDAIVQLWLFILVPLVGALAAGATYGALFGTGGVAPLEETTQA